ncbi:MAG TPA: acyl-CoA dehydrogenase, partial [Anaerolineae bacterium]|nr:acyl-CoA dehydrogenase [Anaerolineae bacterium]
EHSVVTAAVATEAFAWGDLATTLKIMAPNQVAIPIMLCGTETQKAELLPLFSAETPPPVAAALTEPTYQFDPRDLQTTVTSDGTNYRLNGKKIFVIGAADAETLLVYAQQTGATQAFLVSASAEGVTIGERDKLMGLQALDTFSVSFDNVLLTPESKVGGEAGIDFTLILNHSRVALGAAAVGVARAGLEYAVEYAKGREQFGRKIAQNQSIAFMLADMASDVESARMLVWEAAWLLDQGQAATQACTVMKHFVDRIVVEVADRALQTLGGYGYIREYPVELWLRNARAFATFDGMAIV